MRKGIFFDELYQTFYLFCGNSLYAFSIGPELQLENLYWGEAILTGYDLRYQQESLRNLQFTTIADKENIIGNLFSDIPVKASVASKRVMHKSKSMLNINLSAEKPVNQSVYHSVLPEWSPEWRDLLGGFSGKYVKSENLPNIHKDRLANLAWRVEFMQRHKGVPLNLKELLFCNFSESGKSTEYACPFPLKDKVKTMLKSLKGEAFPLGSVVYHNFTREKGLFGKDMLRHEFSDIGSGDFRPPSFRVVCPNGSSYSPLVYIRHVIYNGKLHMPDCLPGVNVDTDDASTLVVTLQNLLTGLEVDLIYVCLHNYDAITRRSVFRNASNLPKSHPCFRGRKIIEIACSMTIDLPPCEAGYYLTTLNGRWANDFFIEEEKVVQVGVEIGSSKGVVGHDHHPFIALSDSIPNEKHGEVKGFAFVYSGNFAIQVEMNYVGVVRVNVGMNPINFKKFLNLGESFATPEVILVRSSAGIGGLSRSMHNLIRNQLLRPCKWSLSHQYRTPICVNSWYANGINVSHDFAIELGTLGKSVGADCLVLDNGWYDTVGDWEENCVQFPFGLKGLYERLQERTGGMLLGVFIQPELVASKSKIFHKQPAWILGVDERNIDSSVDDMRVLDFSCQVVRDHVFQTLCALIDTNCIQLIKWELSRPLMEFFSRCPRFPESQDETSHLYVLGIYEVQKRLLEKYPDLILMMSACGGARLDLGMLFYSHYSACTDNTDPTSRICIQYGASYLYSPNTYETCIAKIPDKLTGNITRLRTRSMLAMSGCLNIGLNLLLLPDELLDKVTHYIQIYKSIASIIQNGDLYRLWNPFCGRKAAWMFVSDDKEHAIVFAFSVNSEHWNFILPRLCLEGLIPNAEYIVWEPLPNDVMQKTGDVRIIKSDAEYYQLGRPTVVLTGSILMNVGLPMKFFSLDDSLMFLLTMKPLSVLPLPPQISRQRPLESAGKRIGDTRRTHEV